MTVLEGSASVTLIKYPDQTREVRAGQMVDVPAGAVTIPEPVDIDLDGLVKTSPLTLDFPPLPSQDLIMAAIQQQTAAGNPHAAPAPPTPDASPESSPGMQVTESESEVKINLVGDILFDFDKTDIRSQAEPTLTQLLTLLQKYPNANVLIEGHTDGKGAQPYNLKLSERRAASVKAWLVAHGFPEPNVWTRGIGAEKPIAPNGKAGGADNPEGRQKNRRVEITVKK
jgi:outer membrane protein OmpA-like peptidoglycan-associated protein